jgi:hypothetical protein
MPYTPAGLSRGAGLGFTSLMHFCDIFVVDATC